MEQFTPVTALIGGGLIGLAVTILWAGIGRTAGISSIGGGIFPFVRGELSWRLAFLVGLPVGALIAARFAPSVFDGMGAPVTSLGIGAVALVVAGVLVGIGTRLGHGCTSGHGICGLARLSPRSLVAVAVFMGTAMVTVYVARHVLA
jgi:uncharacterized membrane protein YedE/YeeE